MFAVRLLDQIRNRSILIHQASGRIADATRSLTQLSIARAMSAYADWMLTRRPEFLQTILEVTAWLKPVWCAPPA